MVHRSLMSAYMNFFKILLLSLSFASLKTRKKLSIGPKYLTNKERDEQTFKNRQTEKYNDNHTIKYKDRKTDNVCIWAQKCLV